MNVITGFHAIEERVRSVAADAELPVSRNHPPAGSDGKNAAASYKILYSKPGPRVKKIVQQAAAAGIPAQSVSMQELDAAVQNLPAEIRDHRGIVLIVSGEEPYIPDVDLETFIKTLPAGRCVVVILDGITDPHNVGAIIRSCDQFGVQLLIVPSRGKAGSSEVVQRTSAGASAWIPVAVVPNLTRAACLLKDAGFWIYGADANGDPLPSARLPEKTALIMGSEGTGISRLLKTTCDGILSIPTCGRLDSLNVSVAAGILLYELTTRR